MLLELRIENLLLIERAELRLGPGLNAITGETGAGKTILARSFDLLMGGKARPQIVRPGAPETYVEGVFELPDGLLEDPELAEVAERLPEGNTELVIGRRVSASGRTSAFLAGRSATVADLQVLGSRLLAFYGQHEHRRLTLAGAQLETLDGFAGDGHLERVRAYREAHAEVLRLERELARIREREGARERDLDILRYELQEIEAAKPDPAEEADLLPERERLRHAEALRGAAAEAIAALSGEDAGASEAVGTAEAALVAQSGVDRELDRLGESARGLRVELQELAGELRGYAEAIETEPGALEQVEERLAVLERLKRKHGGTIESVLEHAEHCRREIEGIEGAGGATDELEPESDRGPHEADGPRRAAQRGPRQVRPPPGEAGGRSWSSSRWTARGWRWRWSPIRTASGRPARSESSSGWRPTPGCPSRRCARRLRGASSRA